MASPIDVITAFLRAFSLHDPDVIADMVSETFRNEHRSSLGSDCVGREEYRKRLPHFLNAFEDPRYEVDDLVSQRRDAVTDVVVQYRFLGHYQNTKIEIPGVMWFTVRGQHITKRVDTWDSLTFLEQTGSAPVADDDL
jgi:hypothetical protein